MNMIERGRRFVQRLRVLAGRSVWEWRQCNVQKPLAGRQPVEPRVAE